MDKLFFIKKFFLPVGMFSLIINLLMMSPVVYMLQLQDKVIASKSEETLWLLTALLFLVLVVLGSLEIIRSRLLVTANNAIDIMIAPFLFKKITETSGNPEDPQNSHLMQDLTTVRTFLTGPSIVSLLDAPWLPIYMLILFLMNPLLFFIIVIGSCLMMGLTILTEHATKKPLSEASSSSRTASQFFSLAIRNAEVVNSMGMIDSIIKRWSSVNNHVLRLQTSAGNKSATITGISKSLRQLLQALAMGSGTYVILTDPTFSIGMMIAGGILYGKALGPLEFVTSGWKSVVEARAAYARVSRFIETVQLNQASIMELPPPTGQITLEHVTFGIRSQNKVVLRDVSLNLSPGDTLGVVGPSASGKSTLSRILVGVWKPIQGDVRVDGADISNWPPGKLGKYVGYLPQDIELFNGTVAENIARLDDPDSEKVIGAAKLAGLHETILQLSNGYDTQIGDGGSFLSGGQRQRIGLARAMYNNPKIVVLDEPNSNLDTEGENALLNALDFLKQSGATTVIVTHNPNYLNKVDKLLVLQYGSVAAFGPKEWVLARLKKANQTNANAHSTTSINNSPVSTVPQAHSEGKVTQMVKG